MITHQARKRYACDANHIWGEARIADPSLKGLAIGDAEKFRVVSNIDGPGPNSGFCHVLAGKSD